MGADRPSASPARAEGQDGAPSAWAREQARKLFRALSADIRDRQGLGDEWERIPADVMDDELQPAWLGLLARALDAARAEGREGALRVLASACKKVLKPHEVEFVVAALQEGLALRARGEETER